MELPTTHLTLTEIEAILYREAPPARHEVIHLALEAKNNHLYRSILNDVFKALGDQGFGVISREALQEIVKDNITWFVHRPMASSRWTGEGKAAPQGDSRAGKPEPRFSSDLVGVD